ncbi:MAG: signal peptide peptidase SppA [Candidatus Cloacimonetes bacterium]|nr:signal peptide peptidase SppA [Candidatus Cloacimonadota bacterium]
MKKLIIILMLTSVLIGLQAHHSIADTDNFMAAIVNPAALSFGNAAGIAFINDLSTDDPFQNMSFIFNTNNFSYYLNIISGDEMIEKIHNHKLTLSRNLFRNFYHGASYNWTNKDFKDGEFQKSVLYRPFNFVSLGAVAKKIFRSERNFGLGVALRPLFFSNYLKNRVSFSTDIAYDEDWSDPVFGVQTEILDGFHIGGYTKYDTDEIGLNFSYDMGNFKVGALHFSDGDSDNDVTQSFVNISNKALRNFIIKPKKNKIYDFKLSGKIIEKKPKTKIGPITISMGKSKTIQSLIDELEELKDDDRIGGIVIKSGNFRASFANHFELKEAFLDFKSTGKKVIFYYNDIGNANYVFAASVGDAIYLNPLGGIDIKGISANFPYLRTLLDSIGVEVVNFRSHPYKTAGNMFSEKEMTDAERESYEYLLGDLYDEQVKMIEEGRGKKLKYSVETIINNGPYFISKDALSNGLVDGLIYEDQLSATIEENFGKSKKIIKKKPTKYVRYDWSDAPEDKIALIYAVGNIHMGKGKNGKTIGSVTTAKAIKSAREDKSVKGIIIRVDSGGGSALASDIIAREVALCNEGDNAKPVVISMAGMAASGGYYISAFADKIIAQPTTITGSIGVVGMIPNYEKLYDKIGVNWSNVKSAKHADIGSSSRKMTDEEKEMISSAIEDIYWTFIQVVADGRDKTKDDVHEIAKGRVWTGNQAFDRGLVDKLGGMKTAVDEIKDIAKLKHEVKLIEFDSIGGDIDVLSIINSKQAILNSMPTEIKSLMEIYNEMKMYEDDKVLLILPHKFELE